MNRTQGQISADIMERVRARDPVALEIFFESYFDRVYAYVCRLLRDPEEAQDVAQVAFMKIHRALHTFDPSRDPSPWVFTIASNTVRDYWRSRRYKQSLREKPIDKVVLPDRTTPADELSARNISQALFRALHDLSEKLRAVVLLREFEDLSYAEIASALGISEEACRKRHSRGIAELRRALDRADPPPESKRDKI